MKRALLPSLILLILAGCTQFPELDETATPGVAEAPFPELVPLDGLLAAPATPPVATKETIGQVEGRVSGLRNRASRLHTVNASQPASTASRLKRLRQKAAALREES